MVADRQAWCLAAMIVDRRGEGAFEEVVGYARTALARRDVARFEIWAEIAALIREMQRPLCDGEAVN